MIELLMPQTVNNSMLSSDTKYSTTVKSNDYAGY